MVSPGEMIWDAGAAIGYNAPATEMKELAGRLPRCRATWRRRGGEERAVTIAAALVDELRAILPPTAVVAEAGERAAYGRDFWAQRGVPGAVVRAGRAEEVAATLRFAAAHGVPVVPRGAGTNVSAGFVPALDRILLDLRPLDRVLAVDPARREAIVEPGVLNGELNTRLAPLGLCFSPDPASAALATIGGNIAENAGGPHCLKYGVTVHHVKAVECVLAGGQLRRFSAVDVGPDLLGVIVGSEGTLGVVTRATLALRPLPAVTRTLLAIFDRAEAAAEAVAATIAAGIVPAALEYIYQTAARLFESFSPAGYPTDAEALLLVDIDGDASEVARDLAAVEAILGRGAREVRRADDDATRAALWRGRLLGAQALLTSGFGYFICDTTVPRERIPAMQRAVGEIARRHGLRIPMLGHAGDGNIHPIILFDRDDPVQRAAMRVADDEIVAAALAFGGTLTGEHGVGSEKRRQMPRRFGPVEIAAMRAVKGAFDPGGVLNPGVLLPDPVPGEPPLPRFAAATRAALASAGIPTESPSRSDQPAGVAAAPIDLDRANLTVTAAAATPLTTLHELLARDGFRCALPGAGGGDSRTVGDLIAGGSDRAVVRDALLAVRATLPDGGAARFGSSAVKDVAGYDLKRLYIGSGDAFGTLEEATLAVQAGRGIGGT